MRFFLMMALLALLPATAPAAEADGRRHFETGREAERQGELEQAYLAYSQARAHDPTNRRYIEAAERVRPSAQPLLTALAAATTPSEAPAKDERETTTPEPQDAALEMRSPLRLEPDDRLAAFDLDGSTQEAWDELAATYGLRVIYDEDYRADRPIRFAIDEVDFPRAAYVLGEATKSIVVPVGEKLFLVADDTPQKRVQLEPVAFAAFEAPNAASPEALQELQQAVQQTLDVKRLQRAGNLLYMRDTVRKVRMAREMIRYLSVAPAEVLFEIELLAVNRDRVLDYGLSLPTTYPVTNFTTALNNQPPDPGDDVSRLIGIGGGDSAIGVTVGSAELLARLQANQGETVQRFQLRATHGLQADLRIGERFPIINASFSASIPAGDDGSPLFQQPIPSFTFEDLGLICTLTPTVHSEREVSLEMEVAFTLLAGGAVNGVPILSNREIQSRIRLKAGEAALISGMVVREQRRSGSGLWPLAALPWIGRFFRQPNIQVNDRDLILTIRPHVVRLPPGEVARPPDLRFGPETRPLPGL